MRDRVDSIWWLYRDARRMEKQGPTGVAQRQRERLADLVAFARQHSVFYRDRYRDLPARVDDPTLLPVTTKAELMARFDDWVSDPAVTLQRITAHLADPDRIGELVDDRYLVTTTSGTSGTRGIFVLDDRYWVVATAPVILRRWLTAKDLAAIIGRRGRFAQLIATGGHYMSYAANRRTQRRRGGAAGQLRVFSVHSPMLSWCPR
jgi:phenylacetate-CoA ligase